MSSESNAYETAGVIRVVIVENNEEQANLMRHGLQFHESKFEVEVARSITEARAILNRCSPDILISELTFDDGHVSDLLAADPETEAYPVVVFTENGSEKDAVDLLKAGVLDYVVKTRRGCQEIGDLIRETLRAWNRIRDIREAEVKLQQTLRLARSIMDSLPNPVGVLDEEGRLLLVNQAWMTEPCEPRLHGESLGVNTDYLGYCVSIENSIGNSIALEIQQVLAGQVSNSPINYCTEGPVINWFSVSVHPCHGSGRARAIVIHQDITERKQLEVNRSEREIAEQKIIQLTPRERQVMELVVGGKPNKAIAGALSISVKTVEMHRSNLMKKLKLGNVTDLVKLAVNAGILQAEEELV